MPASSLVFLEECPHAALHFELMKLAVPSTSMRPAPLLCQKQTHPPFLGLLAAAAQGRGCSRKWRGFQCGLWGLLTWVLPWEEALSDFQTLGKSWPLHVIPGEGNKCVPGRGDLSQQWIRTVTALIGHKRPAEPALQPCPAVLRLQSGLPPPPSKPSSPKGSGPAGLPSAWCLPASCTDIGQINVQLR